MHEHQFDPIAALADGTATAEEAAAAEAAMADCSECADHYAAQAEVLAWVNEAQPVRMTDLERASLHRRLAAETRPRPGWFTRYAPRVAAVAAGFAVVGLATVSMLGRGADTEDAAFDTIAATLESATDLDDSALRPPQANEELLQSAEEMPVGGADFADDDATSDMATEAPADDRGQAMFFFDQESIVDLLDGDIPAEVIDATDEVLERLRSTCPDTLDEALVTEAALYAMVGETETYVLVTTTDSGRKVTAYSVADCTIVTEAQTDD